MSNDKNMTLTRFREHMGGFFHELFRASGITMTPTNSNERVRAIGERMARTIEAAAETKSIEVIRRLQTAVKDSFIQVEASLTKLEALATKHHELIGTLLEQQKSQEEVIVELEERILELEEPDDDDDSEDWR